MATQAEIDERIRKMDVATDLANLGAGLYETWVTLAYKEPPEDFFGRILWSFGVLGQLVISVFTFPAALAAFLLEEAVQTYGMGAYMLSTAKAYETLETYLLSYEKFIDGSEIGAKTLATLNPMTGGAVLIYMQAAKYSHTAFTEANDLNLIKKAKTDEALRKKLLEEQKYGSLAIRSSPTNADIYIDGENTELLTPETFKNMEEGTRVITLWKYNKSNEVWDSYTFEVEIVAGRRKEIFIHIPKAITSEEEEEEEHEEDDTPTLPLWITADVRGERAIDGDTFETTTGERIRLLGIDAPELGQPWADISKEYLASKVEDHTLEIKIQTHLPIDDYGRTLAMVYYRDQNLSVGSCAAGLSRAFIAEDARYDPTRILAAEEIAKARRIGIWSEMP